MATTDSHAAHAAHSSPADAEPQTPMWLPAVGVLLFLGAGVYAIATRTPDTGETEGATAAASAAPTQTAAPARPTGTPRPPGRPPTIPPSNATLKMPNGQTPTLPVMPRKPAGH